MGLSEEQLKNIQDMLDLLPKHTKSYRVATVARCWGLGRATLYKYMDAGELLYAQVGGSKRLTYDHLHQFLILSELNKTE